MSAFTVTSIRALARNASSRSAVASSSRLAVRATLPAQLASPCRRSVATSSSTNATAGPSTSNTASVSSPKSAEPIALPGQASPTVAPAAVQTGYTATALPPTSDPLISSWINLLMRDGKKASATSHILAMLRHIAAWLHCDPLPALAAATEAASPLVRTQTSKSGGKSVAVPLALTERQSRRRGIVNIIDASKKRNDRELSARLAREVCAVLEGNSSVLAKKEEQHRFATVNRSNMSVRV